MQKSCSNMAALTNKLTPWSRIDLFLHVTQKHGVELATTISLEYVHALVLGPRRLTSLIYLFFFLYWEGHVSFKKVSNMILASKVSIYIQGNFSSPFRTQCSGPINGQQFVWDWKNFLKSLIPKTSYSKIPRSSYSKILRSTLINETSTYFPQ